MSETTQGLVEQLAAAGEWPEPRLLEAVVAQGDESIEPLREILRREVHGWPEEAPLDHAIHLLGVLQAAATVPELIGLFRHYDNETIDSAAEALAQIGPPAVEPALAIARDATVHPSSRSSALSAAVQAAGEDPVLRAACAATARELLANVLARARELAEEAARAPAPAADAAPPEGEAMAGDGNSLPKVAAEAAEDQDWEDEDSEEDEELDEEDWEDEDIEEPNARDDELSMATMLVSDLAHLADAQGRDLIQDAYDAHIVDDWFIGPADVAELYREGGSKPRKATPGRWLEQYRQHYQDHIARERREAREKLKASPTQKLPPTPGAPPLPLSGPPRKIGRNDPCWCRSGKKYKHCHWRQDRG